MKFITFGEKQMLSEGTVSHLFKSVPQQFVYWRMVLQLILSTNTTGSVKQQLGYVWNILWKYRGFPGMIGSIDCMHWEWKNCPTAWKGQYSRGLGTLNDINVLDRSPVFDDIINSQVLNVTFFVNGREYHMAYYLTDEPEVVLFGKKQEAVRKDVERAFGVLQARFAIVKNPAVLG
uniref:Uncharacterized protein n=1 Tax=Brassica oleracea TaxID=3712 RepID=A0A3P6F5P3_BRAOL|nr:unnamed protein product [Brassica oleracea]